MIKLLKEYLVMFKLTWDNDIIFQIVIVFSLLYLLEYIFFKYINILFF